jgi:phage terminase large subunit GpA-like protein
MEHVRYSNYKKRANYPFVYDKKKVCVTGGIDVHKRSLVGVFNAYLVDEQGYLQNAYLLDWVIPYEIKDPDNPDALYRALCDVRDYLSDGWADSVGTRFGLNACGIDSGWQDTKRQMTRLVAGADYQVYRFSREYGQGTWRATKGQPNLDEGIIKNVLLEREKVYLWHIDTDLAKCEVHDIMRVPPGEVGFWHIAQDTPRLFGQGIAAEKREMVFDTKNREKAEWVRTDPYNHTLDASVYSWAMARALGVKPPRKMQEA